MTVTSDTTYPDGRKWHTVQTWSLQGEGRLTVEFNETGMNAAPTSTRRVYARR